VLHRRIGREGREKGGEGGLQFIAGDVFAGG